MVRFSALVISSWIVSAAASIRSREQNRKLSYEKIAGYEPGSKVTDHNALDLDQAHMESLLKVETDTSYANAKAVYEEGGNSKSYAVLTMDAALTKSIDKKTVIVGKNSAGVEIRGKTYAAAAAGEKTVKVQYDTSEEQVNWVLCRVGALQDMDGDGSLYADGCFVNTGSVIIGDESFTYTYDQLVDNKNGRTIQGFSTAVQSKMIACDLGCPQVNAEMFKNYYGVADYGDMWVTAAFDKTATAFEKGNADFSDDSVTGFVGRREAIKKGTVYLNIFMYVIREFEDAITDCKTECDVASNCNDDPVHAWDEGVAFYSGSLEGADGASGKMLHEVADKRCGNYGTCGADGKGKEGNSYVNIELFKLFNQGKDQLRKGECGAGKATVKAITNMMYIPLIQGTLRYAYKVGVLNSGEKEKAEGAVFAAGVLPLIDSANANAAVTIYDNMKIGAASTDFNLVRSAFEDVYSELDISCDDIGGLLNSEKTDYFEDFKPCTDSVPKETSSASVFTAAVPMVLTLIVSMFV